MMENHWLKRDEGGDEGTFLDPKHMFFVLKIHGNNDVEDSHIIC